MKARATRFWIEIIAISCAAACGLALLLATFAAATAASDSAPSAQASQPALSPSTQVSEPTPAQATQAQDQAYEGMVTDTHCGAKHDADIGKGSSDCTRACVHAGSQFALVNGDKIYILSGDMERLKQAAGQRSKVVGTLNGDTIVVSSITQRL